MDQKGWWSDSSGSACLASLASVRSRVQTPVLSKNKNMDQRLNVRLETLKLPEEKIQSIGNDFLSVSFFW
jgi:hypothetical protein